MAEIWKCHSKVCPKPMRENPLQVQALKGRAGVLWGRLVQATKKGGTPARLSALHC